MLICLLFQAERGIADSLFIGTLTRILARAPRPAAPSPIRRLYILIPVFKEQAIIIDTLARFAELAHPSCAPTILAITTIRETSEGGCPTTEEVIEQALAHDALKEHAARVRIVREEEAHGNMATQLNAALARIRADEPAHTPYAVFNADSIPSPYLLHELVAELDRDPTAFQLPCAYVRDMSEYASNFQNALALYQTWYCLGHESRLIRDYARAHRTKRERLGVITGHGSGMSLSMWRDANGYPTDLMTEDLTLGFLLSAKRAPIQPVVSLELADVPRSWPIFTRQRSVWFWNYLGYISCYRRVRREGVSRATASRLFLQGMGAGAYWFFLSLFFLVPFVVSARYASPLVLAVAVLGLVAFGIAPVFFLFKRLPPVLRSQGFAAEAERVGRVSFLTLVPSLALIFFTDSLGPWIATLRYVRYLCTGSMPTKGKTED